MHHISRFTVPTKLRYDDFIGCSFPKGRRQHSAYHLLRTKLVSFVHELTKNTIYMFMFSLKTGLPTLLLASTKRRISRFTHTDLRLSQTKLNMAPDHRSQPRSKLQEWFPNTKLPVIISAPMLGVSNGTLAAQVSKAGGFGKAIQPITHS